jgi:hypothetical protein
MFFIFLRNIPMRRYNLVFAMIAKCNCTNHCMLWFIIRIT